MIKRPSEESRGAGQGGVGLVSLPSEIIEGVGRMSNSTAGSFYQTTATAIAHYLQQELKLVYGTHYSVVDATSGPRVLALTVILNPRYARQIMGMSDALSMAAGLDRGASIRIERGRRGTLALEIPKPRDLWFSVPVAARSVML